MSFPPGSRSGARVHLMVRHSAGLLAFRYERPLELEIFLVHPGGPFWTGRDHGTWSIPKGEYSCSDDPVAVARREFAEEIGLTPPDGNYLELGSVRQRGGKLVTAFAVEATHDLGFVKSNTFEIEWPRGSGRIRTFPEIDRAEWFDEDEARVRLLGSQLEFIERLKAVIDTGQAG